MLTGINISGGFMEELRGLAEKISNPGQALESSAKYVAGEISENFRAGGRPRWAGGKFLKKSGSLKKSATSVKIAGNRAEIGGELTNLPYARVHQNGSKNIPARPYMNLPVAWKNTIISKFKEYMLGVENDTI